MKHLRPIAVLYQERASGDLSMSRRCSAKSKVQRVTDMGASLFHKDKPASPEGVPGRFIDYSLGVSTFVAPKGNLFGPGNKATSRNGAIYLIALSCKTRSVEYSLMG